MLFTIDNNVKNRFLKRNCLNPRVPSAALSSMKNCYKIKLRDVGYRLIYQVEDEIVFVSVIAIGRRDKNKVYKAAELRLK